MAIGKLGKLIFFFKHEILGHPFFWRAPYSAVISASHGIQNGEPKPMAKSWSIKLTTKENSNPVLLSHINLQQALEIQQRSGWEIYICIMYIYRV